MDGILPLLKALAEAQEERDKFKKWWAEVAQENTQLRKANEQMRKAIEEELRHV